VRTIEGKPVFNSLEELLRPEHTAVLVVDMQNDVVGRDGAYARQGDVSRCEAVVPRVAALVAMARAAGAKVVYTLNTTLPGGASDTPAWLYFKTRARPGIDPTYTLDGTWGQRLVDELEPRPGEPVVKKHRSDAFVGSNLDIVLRGLGVATVAVAGVVTHGCVEATIRHAAFADYYTALVEDCCAAEDRVMHEAALKVIGARHDLVRSERIAELWRTA
jgi:ureidoacrylate peracid hydrolase